MTRYLHRFALFLVLGLALSLSPGFAKEAAAPTEPHALALQYHKKGDLDTAEKYYLQAIDKDPKNPVIQMDYADLLMLKGKFQDARAHYEAAIAAAPGNATAHTNLGLVYEALGDLEKAEKEHKQALKTDPNHPQAHLNLGHVFELKGLLEEAKAEYKKAILINVNYLLAYESLGQVMGQTGDYNGSAEVLQKALSIDPGSAAIHNNLAHAYFKMGDYDKAVQELEKTLELDPNNEVIKKNLEYLKEQMANGGKVASAESPAPEMSPKPEEAEAVSEEAIKASLNPPVLAPKEPEATPEPVETQEVAMETSEPATPQADSFSLDEPDAAEARRKMAQGGYHPEEGRPVPASTNPTRIPAAASSAPEPAVESRPNYDGPKPIKGSHGFTSQALPMSTYTVRLYPVEISQKGQMAGTLQRELTQKLYNALEGLGIFKVEMAAEGDEPEKDKYAQFVVHASLTSAGASTEKVGGFSLRGGDKTTSQVVLDLSVVDHLNQELHTNQIIGSASGRGFLLYSDELNLQKQAMDSAAQKAAGSLRGLMISAAGD